MNLDIRLSGRAQKPLVATQVAELTERDLVLLDAERGIKPPPLKRLTERHHALARLLAQGTPPGEAQIIVGLTASRVSILKADPAFKELIDFYAKQVSETYYDMHKSMAGLGLDAVQVLREKLEDEPDEFTPGQLLEIVKVTADRTGYGPKTTQDVNVNVGLADKLEAARARIKARQLIDLTATEVVDDA